jgi:hypothetical protein
MEVCLYEEGICRSTLLLNENLQGLITFSISLPAPTSIVVHLDYPVDALLTHTLGWMLLKYEGKELVHVQGYSDIGNSAEVVNSFDLEAGNYLYIVGRLDQINSFSSRFSKNFFNIYAKEPVEVGYISSGLAEYTPQVHDTYMTQLAQLVRKHQSEVQVEVKNQEAGKVASTLAISPYGAPGKHFILNVLRVSLNPTDFKGKDIINLKLLFEAVNKKLPVHSCRLA